MTCECEGMTERPARQPFLRTSKVYPPTVVDEDLGRRWTQALARVTFRPLENGICICV
jgi:hypothetical protein